MNELTTLTDRVEAALAARSAGQAAARRCACRQRPCLRCRRRSRDCDAALIAALQALDLAQSGREAND